MNETKTIWVESPSLRDSWTAGEIALLEAINLHEKGSWSVREIIARPRGWFVIFEDTQQAECPCNHTFESCAICEDTQ